MAGCCDNFSMIDGGDEFKAFPGLKGEDGTTYYPHVSSEGVLSWTNDGGKTNPASVDISGPPGRSVEMRGPVASVSDLPTTAPSDELWLVGSTSPYDGWFYNGTSWQNIGQISVGPQGPQGEQGEDGFSPAISTNEVSGGCFITITDATGTETIFLSNGASAGFGTPTATVDANVGTPSVEVTATGPNTAKVFNFAFHNLKGESGGGGGGTSDYNDLSNKPQIQGVTLSGNKTASDLGLALATAVLPAGGSTRDFLIKSSNTDYAAEWASVYSSATPNMDGTGSAGISSTFSRSDHVHPKDTTKQDKIIVSGILKSDGSGGVSAATKGTDYGALAFTVTLTAAGWSGNAQTISNANFIASGFAYTVAPASGSFSDYASAQIYADDVTVAGQMTFHCATAPSAALTVNVMRVVSA